MRKKILLTLCLSLLLLVGILLFNTLRYSSKQYFLSTVSFAGDTSAFLRLSQAVRFKTVSYEEKNQLDSSSFGAFLRFLAQAYPLADSLLNKETINGYSVLYTWKGKNETLKPVLLLAHSDVVPAEGKWQEDPFAGTIKSEFIWGRGTLDDKVSILGILEATERLLQEKYTPERTIYFAFGHDEEVMGRTGASHIARLLRERKVEAEFILDEGLVVTDGIVPGIDKKVALIGIAEKGYLTLKLTCAVAGGHGSMPAKENSIGILSKAIVRLQENKFPAVTSEPVEEFLDYVGPEMPFFKKIIFANRWMFKGLVINAYEKTPSGNALVRTTVSPNIIHGGIKDNVIPHEAQAVLNIRTLPGKSNEQVVEEIKTIIQDDRINIETVISLNPSSVSSAGAPSYKVVEKTIRQLFPDTYVAPSLMIAGTDSKHYAMISSNIYRFLPIRLTKEDLERIHGSDERIHKNDYQNVIGFYYQLFRNINQWNKK